MTPYIREIPCSICTCSDQTAKVECLDCKKYLCHNCYVDHNKFIKDHRFITLSDLFSGKVSLSDDEDNAKICSKHGKKVEFFCKTSKKSVCSTCVESKDCPDKHARLEIEKSIGNYDEILQDLVKACNETKTHCQEAARETEKVQKEFQRNKVLVGKALARLKKEYILMMEKIFQKHAAEIAKIDIERTQQIDDMRIKLESTIVCIDLACKQVGKMIPSSGSSDASVFRYASLCNTFQNIVKTDPEAANKALGFVTFNASTPPLLTSFGRLLLKEASSPDTTWKLQSHFITSGLTQPTAIAVCKNGNIVVTCWQNNTTVFSRSGDAVTVFQNSSPAVGVFATEHDEYIVAHVNDHRVTWYDANGVAVRAVPVPSMDSTNSPLNSIAVDRKGRIIVATVNYTIAVCAPHVISKFETQMKPFRIAATSDDRIVVSMYSDELQKPVRVEIMDYSGRNATVIQPPLDVHTWQPSFLCCSTHDEFFVSNIGNPSGVYRFSVDGDYLECVAIDIGHPAGLALFEDEMELCVVDSNNKQVNIYRRQ